VLSVQQAAAGLSVSVPAANAALNNLLAAGIVSLVDERQWGRVFQATQVLRRLDHLPAPRQGSGPTDAVADTPKLADTTPG
jgi:hypothetical protein